MTSVRQKIKYWKQDCSTKISLKKSLSIFVLTVPINLSLNFSGNLDPSVPEFVFCGYDSGYLEDLSGLAGIGREELKSHDDMEKAAFLCHWTSSQWRHSGSNVPLRGDPVSILNQARSGERFRCVEYSIVMHGILCTAGIIGRVLYLRTADVETRKSGAGHVVVEAYIEKYRKWVMFDPQNDVYAVDRETPLNALELALALENGPDSVEFPTIGRLLRKKYKKFIQPYLYYFHSDLKMKYPQDYPRTQVVLMPMNSKIPEKFQGTRLKEIIIPTNSYPSFYPGQDDFLM
jgi:hypothetical protein